MKANRKVSIKRLLLSIESTFNFQDNAWKDDAIEFIGRGLEIIGVGLVYTKKAKEVALASGRATLPCSLKSLRAVTLDGCRLDINEYTDFVYNSTDLTTPPVHSHITAQFNDNYLITNVDTGTVVFYYYAFSLDDEGLPQLPDDAFVFEALEWYVVYKLLLKGYKHHAITNFREAQMQWEIAYPRAQNSLSLDDVVTQENFTDHWITAFSTNPTRIKGGF